MNCITLKYLVSKKICQKQQDIFQETFGESVEVNLKNLLIAQKAELNCVGLLERFYSLHRQYKIDLSPHYTKLTAKYLPNQDIMQELTARYVVYEKNRNILLLKALLSIAQLIESEEQALVK